MWWKMILAAIAGLAVIISIALIYGWRRWESETKNIHARLDAARIPIARKTYSSSGLTDLPAPVQKYFRAVLTEGQSMVAAVSLEHSGTFNMSGTGNNWKRFTSTQRTILQRPGFDWDARIALMPGLRVRVYDAYIAREGILHGTLFGLFSVVNLRGTPDIAQGELMRFLAEAAWYPTALLSSQGVQWKPVDDMSAEATFEDGQVVVTLLFRFNENGLIRSVRAEARGRTIGSLVVPTPWEGQWSNYALRDGMLVPMDGEVAWVLPEGPRPYWRGRITSLRFEFGQ